jgi:SAM-dependent methyltransferase
MKIDIGSPSEYGVSGIQKRLHKMNKILPIKGIGLDLGTGKGAYFDNLLNYTDVLFACDKTLSFLKEFKQSYTQNVSKIFVSTSEYCSVKSEMFDVVFAIEVLEHVEDLDKSLLEINRILKPNGYLYLTVPNKYFPFETHMIHFRNFYLKGKYIPFLCMSDYIHSKIGTARRFSQNELYRLSSENGFEFVGADYMMPPFDYWNFGKKMFLKLGNYFEESFLKFFSMTLISVLKKT